MKPISETGRIKEMSWCHKHGLTIYPVPVEGSNGMRRPMCYIEINNQGKIHRLKDTYRQDLVMFETIVEEYKRIYNKNQ